ncbi:MAG: redox-regulated ATPase YchF, partial [Patescibacteria group bacterium]
GIIGLPNVGKSTLFNALLKKQQALVANYPFTTIEPNVGVVPVPDYRLERLAQIVQESDLRGLKPPIKPATVEFVDIAGLVKGANEGAGLGNKFLSHIREVAIIAHVIRTFEDPDVVREGSTGSPLDDYKIVRTELELADLEKGGEISKKPEIIVLNVSEKEYKIDSIQKLCTEYMRLLNLQNDDIVVVSAKIEEELAILSEEEQKEYLADLGLKESGLERLIRKAYEKLDLISFLTTTGGKEVRAWTLRRGSTALSASGEIHTDFAEHFIKAEVVTYEDFVANNGWKGSREHGKTKLEGRDYIVQDGDIIEFKIGT